MPKNQGFRGFGLLHLPPARVQSVPLLAFGVVAFSAACVVLLFRIVVGPESCANVAGTERVNASKAAQKSFLIRFPFLSTKRISASGRFYQIPEPAQESGGRRRASFYRRFTITGKPETFPRHLWVKSRVLREGVQGIMPQMFLRIVIALVTFGAGVATSTVFSAVFGAASSTTRYESVRPARGKRPCPNSRQFMSEFPPSPPVAPVAPELPPPPKPTEKKRVTIKLPDGTVQVIESRVEQRKL